jgi:hypothetical protein
MEMSVRCFCVMLSPVIAHTERRGTAALRDFDAAYDRGGSLMPDTIEESPGCMSGSAQKRTQIQEAVIQRWVSS